MNKLYFLLLLSFYSILSHAQIVCPDTVDFDSSVSFSTPVPATSYTWGFSAADTISTPVGSPVYIINLYSSARYSKMVNNNGHWYLFTTCNHDTIVRFDYGTNPTGTYTTTVLSGFGFSAHQLAGIEVVKDSATNKWYVFAFNIYQLLRMSFDTSLSGPHTDTIMNVAPMGLYGEQLSIRKYGNEWIGFIGPISDKIARLDFGSSITNIPTCTQLPYVGGYTSPENFTLYNEGGNWYMLAGSYWLGGIITRINFGTDIKNNSPTGDSLGTFGGLSSFPESITILKNCDQLIAYVYNGVGSSLLKLDFHGSILNHPDSSSIPGNYAGSATPFVYGDTLYEIITHGAGDIYRQPLLKLNADTTTYYQRQVTYTFTTSGVHDVNLYCDIGAVTGSSAFCKSVFVRPGVGINKVPVNNSGITTYPNPANNEWVVSIQGNEKNAILYLYAIDGKLMQTTNLQSGVNKLNIAGLRAGSYFYRVTGEQNTFTGKLLKQ